MEKSTDLNIGKKAFISSAIILLILMLMAGLMTRFIPAGSFDRKLINGREVIQPGTYHLTQEKTYPVWRWFTAPVEVLGGPENIIIITIIIFILIVGGSFSLLSKSGVLRYSIETVVKRFTGQKYYLLAGIVFIFMVFGAVLGTFEEIIPLVPVVVTLAYSLGWDSLTGLGMSLLAAGFGFASAIANPFSVGVAQKLAGLPMFSGAFFRIIVFLVIYALLSFFLIRYTTKLEKNPKISPVYQEDLSARKGLHKTEEEMSEGDDKLIKAVRWFVGIVAAMLIVILITSFIKSISDFTLPLIALLFLIGGVGSALISGMTGQKVIGQFLRGVTNIAPGIILILMATSVKHIISQSGIMDTILYYAANYISGKGPFTAVILIYIFVLFINFFIGSASAKAFLIMPIVTPLADLIGINRQIAVLAFVFGDGFSNVIYPTNAVLLIGLGLTVVNYPKWFKWIIKLQIIIFLITSIFLGIAMYINYGPY